MEATIKSVISDFIKKDISAIDISTVIDRSAVKSSILVHRMYGALGNAGIVVPDYLTIKTYGDLLSRLNGAVPSNTEAQKAAAQYLPDDVTQQASSIGIDIESVEKLPPSVDYRVDEFYRMNFTPQEISYSSLQSDPVRSFTGLFAAKEAIVKASSRYRNIPFNQIEIDHDESGKPLINNFSISISYMDSVVVAVAVYQQKEISNEKLQDQSLAISLQTAMNEIGSLKRSLKRYSLLMAISLLAAFIAIGLLFFN